MSCGEISRIGIHSVSGSKVNEGSGLTVLLSCVQHQRLVVLTLEIAAPVQESPEQSVLREDRVNQVHTACAMNESRVPLERRKASISVGSSSQSRAMRTTRLLPMHVVAG